MKLSKPFGGKSNFVSVRTNLDVVPFGVVHVVLIDTQLGAGQRDARHFVLQRSDFKVTGNDVMQQKLTEKRCKMDMSMNFG